MTESWDSQKTVIWDRTIVAEPINVDGASIIGLPFQTMAMQLREQSYRPQEATPGTRLGRYVVDEKIGSGGFSSIYRARHMYLDHEVALKTLRSSTSVGADLFMREAQALALMAHTNVVRVLDADIWEGIPFIVLELLVGEGLVDILGRYQRLSTERALDLMEELGSVLVRQEQQGIFHLDIKPANIFQRTNASFCLFDYGLAGIRPRSVVSASGRPFSPVTMFTQAVGTPAYMAPEQVQGKADHRSDLFGLGLTIWECLAGTPAREMSHVSDIGHFIEAATKPIRPVKEVRESVPAEIDAMVSHLTATAPGERYQSAEDFLNDLQSFRYSGKQPVGATVGTAFVAIPFDAAFTATFGVIKDSCQRNRLRARRLDQHAFLQDIWSQCIVEIEAAKVIIADFTSVRPDGFPNPNVVTEAAHARAIRKPLVLITQGKPEDLPFDWRHMPVVTYENTEDGLQRLAELLANRLRIVLQ